MLFSGFARRVTPRITSAVLLRPRPHLQLAYSTRNHKMSTEFEAEKARITELADTIRQLKTDGKPCDTELKEMLDLKKKVGQTTGKKDSGKGKINLKTPKVSWRLGSFRYSCKELNWWILVTLQGTVDHAPSATLLRKQIFNTLESIFVKHGASTIDTPVFELKEILAGK